MNIKRRRSYGDKSGAAERQHTTNRQCFAESDKARQVVHSDETLFKEGRFDAKEKGKNGYFGDGGKKRRSPKGDGRVVSKPEGGFDMKI